jgi:hypothetical protein
MARKFRTLEFRIIPKTILNHDVVYRIYNDNVDLGDCFRGEDTMWHLAISSADIKLHGIYRHDLFEEAEILYNKFMEAHK